MPGLNIEGIKSPIFMLNEVIVNGVKYSYPKGTEGDTRTVVNGKVYVGKFELTEDGKWKISVSALLHRIFSKNKTNSTIES